MRATPRQRALAWLAAHPALRAAMMLAVSAALALLSLWGALAAFGAFMHGVDTLPPATRRLVQPLFIVLPGLVLAAGGWWRWRASRRAA